MATTLRYIGPEPRIAGYGIITGATDLVPGATFKVRDDVVDSYTSQPSLFEVVDAPAPNPEPVVIEPTPTGTPDSEVSDLDKEIAALEAQKAALEHQEANS